MFNSVDTNCTDCVANKVPFTIKIYSPLLIESLCGLVPTDWKRKDAVEPFDQMLTKLKGLEKFGLMDEQKKLLDDVTELIKANKQLEKEAIQ